MKKLLTILMITMLALSMTGIALAQQATGATATATLRDMKGTVVGTANFAEQTGGSVHVMVTLNGKLNAPGLHALHIYSVGSCSPDSFSTGGIFNPIGRRQHSNQPGVLANIDIQPKGTTTYETWSSGFTLQPGGLSLFSPTGSSIVIRANADDMTTSPNGNSGDVIACGVIVAGAGLNNGGANNGGTNNGGANNGGTGNTGSGNTGSGTAGTGNTGTGATRANAGGTVTNTTSVTNTNGAPTTLPVTGGEADPTAGIIMLMIGAALLLVSYLLRRNTLRAH